jgi:hypothetical protein
MTKVWSTDTEWNLVSTPMAGNRFLKAKLFDWKRDDMLEITPNYKAREILPYKKLTLVRLKKYD